MQNNLDPNQLSAKHRTENIPPNQHADMYTQSFVCICAKSFRTLQEYRLHFNQEHSDSYNSPRMAIPFSQDGIQQPQTRYYGQKGQIINISYISTPEYPLEKMDFGNQNLTQKNQVRQPTLRMPGNEKYYNQRRGFNENQISYKTSHSRRIVPSAEERQLNQKYLKNVYHQKMAPFYRQFDIEPYKNSSGSHQKRQAQYQQILQHRNHPKHNEYSVSTTLQDFSLVQEQLYSRMIPLSNGITEFVYNFEKQNQDSLKIVSLQQKQMIARVLAQKIYHLNQLNFLNKRRNFIIFAQNDHDSDDFMNSDLFMALGAFISFLQKMLNPSKLWLVESMMLVVVDVLIDYFSSDQNSTLRSLKVNDFYQFFQKIKQSAGTQKKMAPITVSSEYMVKFLMWFSQWSTIKQYMFNKFNTDFIDALLEQIQHVNQLYRTNVEMYKLCVQKKRTQHLHSMKRKPIDKERVKFNRPIERTTNLEVNSEKIVNPSYKQTISGKKVDKTVTQTVQEKQYYYPYKQTPNRPAFRSNKIEENQSQRINAGRRQMQTSQKKKPDFIFQKQQIYPDKNKNITYSQPKKLKSHLKDNQINGQQNNQLDQDENSLNDQLWFPVYQSQFVNYFSAECQETRKKQKQTWKLRLQTLKLIIQNPQSYRKQLKEQIQEQLRQIDQLSKFLQNELNSMPHTFQSRKQQLQFYREKRSIAHNNKFDEPSINGESSVKSKQEKSHKNQEKSLEKQYKPQRQQKDPFIIKRNFRKRNQNERFHPGKKLQANGLNNSNWSSYSYQNSVKHEQIQLQRNDSNGEQYEFY